MTYYPGPGAYLDDPSPSRDFLLLVPKPKAAALALVKLIVGSYAPG